MPPHTKHGMSADITCIQFKNERAQTTTFSAPRNDIWDCLVFDSSAEKQLKTDDFDETVITLETYEES